MSSDTDSWQKLFHPVVADWFRERYGGPTTVQSLAWPEIASSSHVLVCSPTGSGKTMTAFLYFLNKLLTGQLALGQTHILYISPLKALNNDIKRNLLEPIDELRGAFEAAGLTMPNINIMTRSGDTESSERRRMLKYNPEILITTPESLNILLTSQSGSKLLQKVSAIILDEIHAVFTTKRGTHLITAVERLKLLCGEFQRIALSATINPLEGVADFVGGFIKTSKHNYQKRNIKIIAPNTVKTYDISVRFPIGIDVGIKKESTWESLSIMLSHIIQENNSTILFANGRRTVERLAHFINKIDSGLAWAHHGSLSKEIRLLVEEKLKDGKIKGIVATNSLELGIDIGHCDRVVLVQSPVSVASAIQKLGRAGHNVGETSRGFLVPVGKRDFLEAAVMARCIMDADIEPAVSIDAPLDVLAQVLLSMCATQQWDIDELYEFIICAYPYRELKREHFNLVLAMLEGRYENSKIRGLTPKVSIDRVDNTIIARSGAAWQLYMSGGTIPDRGYYDLRVVDSRAKIGELDEEFVWERTEGDTFMLGTQNWRIVEITHNDVFVSSAINAPGIIPFWRGNEDNRGYFFMQRIASFLETANTVCVNEQAFIESLTKDYCMDAESATTLAGFCASQKTFFGIPLPHRHHIVMEKIIGVSSAPDRIQLVIHTLWGGRLNSPFALALGIVWAERFHEKLDIIYNNDALLLNNVPLSFDPTRLFDLVSINSLNDLLRKGLESSGIFGAHFRENAARSLLLPKGSPKKRMPLWLNRLRSKNLLEAIKNFDDFPVLLETWRSCINDEFELENLKERLNEISLTEVNVSVVETEMPSPFASGILWQLTNRDMYEDDRSPSFGKSQLKDSLIREAALNSHLRPLVSRELTEELVSKLQRTAKGFAPESAIELLDWVKERLLIPIEEWNKLLVAINTPIDELLSPVSAKLCYVKLPNALIECVVALENMPLICSAINITFDDLNARLLSNNKKPHELSIIDGDLAIADFVAQWLSYYGPVKTDFICSIFGLERNVIFAELESLRIENQLVFDVFVEDEIEELCDRENLERLLRMSRRAKQPVFQALPAKYLQFFIARWQFLGGGLSDDSGLLKVLDALSGYPSSSQSFEEFILPARISAYYKNMLDTLLFDGLIEWFGCGKEKIFFTSQELRRIFIMQQTENTDAMSNLFPSKYGAFNLFDLQKHSGESLANISSKLWDLVWQGLIHTENFGFLRNGSITNHSSRREALRHVKSAERTLWRIVPEALDDEPQDLLEQEDMRRELVRQLLRRYGILFREILERELEGAAWKNIFKTLRLMELSGELVTGYFFESIPGLQFMSRNSFNTLATGTNEDVVYWMNATDPASLCGLKVSELRKDFPSRIKSNFLVFHGTMLKVELRRNGQELLIHVPPDDATLPRCLSIFHDLTERDLEPLSEIRVETINGNRADESIYKDVLIEFGFKSAFGSLVIKRQYR